MTLLAPVSNGFLEEDTGAPGLYRDETGVYVLRTTQGGSLDPVGSGGASVIGTSWVILGIDGQPGLTPNVTTTLTLTVLDSLGSDLSLDVDTETIHILTDGYYQMSAFAFLSGAMDDFQLGMSGPRDTGQDFYGPCAVGGGLDIPLTLPVRQFSAGEDVSFYAWANVNPLAGTWGISASGPVVVNRMA